MGNTQKPFEKKKSPLKKNPPPYNFPNSKKKKFPVYVTLNEKKSKAAEVIHISVV